MGVLVPVSARATLHSAPHQNQPESFSAHVCKVTVKHLPQPLRSHTQGFGTLRQLLVHLHFGF